MEEIIFDNFDYQSWLTDKFSEIINSYLKLDIEFKISDEQQFISDEDKEPDVLYIVYKQLVGPNTYNVKSVPYQIMIMSEENQLEIAKNIANIFVELNNFIVTPVGNTFIKHAYSQPSVLSNFNQIDIGVRSIIFIPTTLQMMAGLKLFSADYNSGYGMIKVTREGWLDPETNIQEEVYLKYSSISLSYSMAGDSQQFTDGELATTIKSTASTSLMLSIPLYENKFCQDMVAIMCGASTIKGDTTFTFNFYIGNQIVSLNMKCVSIQPQDSPDEAPIMRLGFTV